MLDFRLSSFGHFCFTFLMNIYHWEGTCFRKKLFLLSSLKTELWMFNFSLEGCVCCSLWRDIELRQCRRITQPSSPFGFFIYMLVLFPNSSFSSCVISCFHHLKSRLGNCLFWYCNYLSNLSLFLSQFIISQDG